MDTPEMVTEAEPQYGLHATMLAVRNGQLYCTVCDKDMATLAPESLAHDVDGFGEHNTELTFEATGDIDCAVCGTTVAQQPPEWAEHNTDVEDQNPVDPGVPVNTDTNEPLEVDHEVKRRPAPE